MPAIAAKQRQASVGEKVKIMNLAIASKVNSIKDRGQSIVELSLLLPILLVALYIPADFGLALFMAQMNQNATREGARIGSGLSSPFGSSAAVTVKSAVFARLPNNSYVTSRSVTIKFYSGASCMQLVEVSAQFNYSFFFYQMMRLFGSSVNNIASITRTSEMRYNYQPNTITTGCTTPTTYGPYSS